MKLEHARAQKYDRIVTNGRFFATNSKSEAPEDELVSPSEAPEKV